MEDWSVSTTLLVIGTGVAVLAGYLLCRMRIEQTRNRILVLEREIALNRIREEANDKKLGKIFDAVVDLRETAEGQLGQLREKLDRLLADSFSERSAA